MSSPSLDILPIQSWNTYFYGGESCGWSHPCSLGVGILGKCNGRDAGLHIHISLLLEIFYFSLLLEICRSHFPSNDELQCLVNAFRILLPSCNL